LELGATRPNTEDVPFELPRGSELSHQNLPIPNCSIGKLNAGGTTRMEVKTVRLGLTASRYKERIIGTTPISGYSCNFRNDVRQGSVEVRLTPTLCILCGLGFLALGCHAGSLNWGAPDVAAEAPPVAPVPQIESAGGGAGVVGPSGGPAGGGVAGGRPVRPVKVPYVANCLPGSEFVATLKYHARAATAYRRYRRNSGRSTLDFEEGFEKGYIDLARGGRGRTPVVAPHRYWGPAYRNPEGQSRQLDWLAGYTAGTQMSQEDGLGLSYPVSINPEVQYYRNESPSWAMQARY
jgi:hypothetical protein